MRLNIKVARETGAERLGSEAGFTLVELIIVTAIISILASLGYTAFSIYKSDAEYAKAEASLRNARTAFEVGDQEATAGLSVPMTYSGDAGEALAGDLATLLPGAVASNEVRLGARYEWCGNGAPAAQVNQTLTAIACKGGRYTSWSKTCGGLEVEMRNVDNPGGCS